MMRPIEVPALLNKRALLVAEIALAERRLASLRASLETVDGAIVAFVMRRHERKESGGTRKHSISRAILDALRQAGKPLTVEEIAERIGRPRREVAEALKRRKDDLIVSDGERWRIA